MPPVILAGQPMNNAASSTVNLPVTVQTEAELDEILTRPGEALIETVKRWPSPLLVLGASGKMGPSLCVLARRAAQAAGHHLRIVAVSRFSDARSRQWLEERGVETRACDLLNRSSLGQLPDAERIVYMVGLKFGTQSNPALTWAVNTLVPSHVAERYPAARIVALSTGNVYPLVPVESGGSTEEQAPAPVGEYGSAALARERIFEYYSRTQGTAMALLRLNYAVELRYGVLVDIAQKVWRKEPVDLTTGYLNCIWQGDANDLILRSLELAASPPAVLNLTGPSVLSVRELARQLGDLMQRRPGFVGAEAGTALLNNPSRLCARLGPPATPLEKVLQWTAQWVMNSGSTLGKPTHFEVRSGQF
jgi:nucleoside-diphosphate-sugar epimerase